MVSNERDERGNELDINHWKNCKAPVGNIDAVVKTIVGEIFDEYMREKNEADDDYLTKEEAKEFISKTLKKFDESLEFAEEDFEKHFKEFDNDNSNQIEKDELASFIKKIAGLDEMEKQLRRSKEVEGDNLFNV